MQKHGTNQPASSPIMNRDIPLIASVLPIMQEVSATEEKRTWNQSRLWNITQRITGSPSRGGPPQGLEASFAEIGELEERYEAECLEYVQSLKTAEEILHSIPSVSMRAFVTMKYLLSLPNKEIMARLNLNRWQFDGMRRAIEQAPDMKSVPWVERYAPQGSGQQKQHDK